MRTYLVQRIASALVVTMLVSAMTFAIMHILPGDPALAALGGQAVSAELVEQLRAELGLNDPLVVQYGRFLGGVLKGDFGRSLRTRALVVDEIAATLPATVQLVIGSLLVAIAIGLPLGIAAAIWQNTWVDWLGTSSAVLGISMPVFWLGLVLISVFSFRLGWLPSAGAGDASAMVLPSLALGFGGAAMITRMTRSSLLDTLHQMYILAARAKGVPKWRVITRHALRNALIPVITTVGLQVGGLLSGAVLIETVFSRPGVGRLLVQAVQARDFPMAQALIFMIAVFYVLINLSVDLVYKFLDPRIRIE